MKRHVLRHLPLFARLGLGILFVYAGVEKLGMTRVFTADIVRLELVPFRWAEWVATALPVAELLTGAWLLSGWRLRAASLAVMLLAAVFAFAVAQAMARGLGFNCHCFGVAREPPSPALVLARAIALFTFATFLYRLAAPRILSSTPPMPAAAPPGGEENADREETRRARKE